MPRQMLIALCVFVLTAADPQQFVAFDVASASSTHSAGTLAGSPVFAAHQALSSGSGYWCSSGGHPVGQSVTWTGVLNSRRAAMGVKVDWAYAPGDVKVLTSSDGSNFEEPRPWQASTRSEAAFEESYMFDGARNVKAITIAMRRQQAWGYFGINSVTLIAESGPFMLVSGITSSVGEQCVVTGATGITLEPCLEAVGAGDGGEVLQFDKDGQIVNLARGGCMTLVDGDTAGGGALAMGPCSTTQEPIDGRTVFVAKSNGQLSMPRLGGYCLTMVGDGALVVDVARDASVVASSSHAQHNVQNAVDGDARSHWLSGSDPIGDVDVLLDFGKTEHIKTIEVEWEHPPQAFHLDVARAGQWTRVYSTRGNNLQTTKYVGASISGSELRIRMARPHPTLGGSSGHALYGIKHVRVLATSGQLVVQDCNEAEDNTDARDTFFMVAVPEFNPRVVSTVKQNAAVLAAAEEHLGRLLADLYVAMPSLAACGFKPSFGRTDPKPNTMLKTKAASHTSKGMQREDAASVAVAAVAPGIGVDMQALQALVTGVQEALTQISR